MKNRALLVVTALVFAIAAGASAKERRWIVAGDLELVSGDTRKIVIDSKSVTLTSATLVRDDSGKRVGVDALHDYEGEYVSVLVSPGSPHPVAETIVMAEEPEDGDE